MDHVHDRPDPSPDWQTCPGLLPRINRWGYLDPSASLHPASVSALIPAITDLATVLQPLPPEPLPEPRQSVRRFSAEDEQAVLDRADAVNARIAALLRQNQPSAPA